MIKVEAIVDGGMIGGNPGKGGWGGRFRVYVDNFVTDEKFFGGSFGEEIVTNNVCEWRAVIGALQTFIEHYRKPGLHTFEIISDSKLIVMQAKGLWSCKDDHLRSLQRIFNALSPHTGAVIYIKHKRREHTAVAHDHIAKILGRTK